MKFRACRIAECTRGWRVHGLCAAHYRRSRLGQDMVAPIGRPRRRVSLTGLCSIAGCGAPHHSTSFCALHYQSLKKYGDPLTMSQRRGRPSGYRIKNGMLEHRLLIGKAIGRPLLRDEHIHHINGVRSDNRLENLELWSVSQPPGQRVADKLKWAYQIIARYEPEYGGLGATCR